MAAVAASHSVRLAGAPLSAPVPGVAAQAPPAQPHERTARNARNRAMPTAACDSTVNSTRGSSMFCMATSSPRGVFWA